MRTSVRVHCSFNRKSYIFIRLMADFKRRRVAPVASSFGKSPPANILHPFLTETTGELGMLYLFGHVWILLFYKLLSTNNIFSLISFFFIKKIIAKRRKMRTRMSLQCWNCWLNNLGKQRRLCRYTSKSTVLYKERVWSRVGFYFFYKYSLLI